MADGVVMTLRKRFILATIASLALSTAASAADHIRLMTKKGKFEDVRDDVVMAIEGRGIKINHHNYIADMLARTGQDLGATKQVYIHGEQIEFCKADLSRAQMEADPSNIVFCPYILSIYTLPKDPNLVHVAFRVPQVHGASPATRKALQDVERLLTEIVKEALR